MFQNKKQIKTTILLLITIIFISQFSLSSLAKTEVYFSLVDNPFLLTGSYNWTFSANNRNDENLMIIDDPDIISRYQNQFEKLWLNKYSPERTRQLYKTAKVDFLPVSPTSPKSEVQIININTASQDELIKILQINQTLVRKITDLPFMSFPRTRESIILREEPGGFKDPQDLTQLPEITNLEWEEWKEQGITITINQ